MKTQHELVELQNALLSYKSPCPIHTRFAGVDPDQPSVATMEQVCKSRLIISSIFISISSDHLHIEVLADQARGPSPKPATPEPQGTANDGEAAAAAPAAASSEASSSSGLLYNSVKNHA